MILLNQFTGLLMAIQKWLELALNLCGIRVYNLASFVTNTVLSDINQYCSNPYRREQPKFGLIWHTRRCPHLSSHHDGGARRNRSPVDP